MNRSAHPVLVLVLAALLAGCGGGSGGPSDDELKQALIAQGYSEPLAECVAGRLSGVLDADDLQTIVDGQDPTALSAAIEATVACSQEAG